MKLLHSFFFISILFTSLGIQSIFAEPNLNSDVYLQVNVNAENDEFEELIKEAIELYRQKKYDEAIVALTKAAEINPKDFRPKALAGIVYLAQFKLKNASEEFDKAILLKPNDKELYLYKARAERLQNKNEDALVTIKKAIEIDPKFADAYLMIGDILRFNKERQEEAFEAYRTAINLDPSLLSAFVNLGSSFVYSKKEKEAEENFRKAMSLDPKKMAGRFELGRLLVKQGRLKEARQLWEEKTNDEDRTFPNFITLLERAENLEKAKTELAKKPNDPETLLQMGYAVMDGDHWVVDGRQKRAIEYFKKALEIKSDFAEAQFAIVKAYIQIADTFKKENENVDKELAKLRKLDPELAKEMEEYRKTYSGGLKTTGPPPPAPPPNN